MHGKSKKKRKRTLEELRKHNRRLQDMKPGEDEPEIEEETGESVFDYEDTGTHDAEPG